MHICVTASGELCGFMKIPRTWMIPAAMGPSPRIPTCSEVWEVVSHLVPHETGPPAAIGRRRLKLGVTQKKNKKTIIFD